MFGFVSTVIYSDAWKDLRDRGLVPVVKAPEKTTVGSVSLYDNIWIHSDIVKNTYRDGLGRVFPFDEYFFPPGDDRDSLARRIITDHRPVRVLLFKFSLSVFFRIPFVLTSHINVLISARFRCGLIPKARGKLRLPNLFLRYQLPVVLQLACGNSIEVCKKHRAVPEQRRRCLPSTFFALQVLFRFVLYCFVICFSLLMLCVNNSCCVD